MPIYEFVCESCGAVVERLQKVSDPPPEGCIDCGHPKMAKIMSRNSFQLKGGGWYRDLYASGSGKAAAKVPASDTASDAASPAPTPATPAAKPESAPAASATPPTSTNKT